MNLNIGHVDTTPGADRHILADPEGYQRALDHHKRGNWGYIYPEDAKANNDTVYAASGGMLLSVYRVNGETVWVYTVGYGTSDVYTTVMLPSER